MLFFRIFTIHISDKTMKNTKVLLLVTLFAISCSTQVFADGMLDRLKSHVHYLSSEELEGRAPGTKGNKKAAEFIRDQFIANGIKPYKSQSYFQEKKGNALSITKGKSSSKIVLEKEWMPLSISDNGNVKAPLVFAGYGISSPSDNYDDYAGLNVKGAVVIVLRGAPEQDSPHGNLMQFAPFRAKAMTAKEKGAVGLICVSGSKYPDSLLPLRFEQGGKVDGIVVANMLASHIQKLIPELAIKAIEDSINAIKKPVAIALKDYAVALTTAVKQVTVQTSNVIGYVPGTDPSKNNEVIVVGAHFDHLGWGGEGSGSLASSKEKAIHFGADDNASGTAGMLETAGYIAKNPLKRPVMFIGFTAEERGLLGSAHFVKQPTIGLDSIAMMMNMDMIGRLKDGKINIGGVGTSSSFKSMIDSLGKAYALTVSTTEDGFGPSDHASFYGKEKPVLFFFTGLHTDYHRPSDTWEKINYDGQKTIIDMALSSLYLIGNAAQKPDYIKVKSSAQPGQAMSFKVSLGITPDYSDHPKGMRITGVREGGPGEKAGMSADDIIIKLGETTVKNVYDYTFALGKFKAGDKTTVVVLRGPREDKEVLLNVEFPVKK